MTPDELRARYADAFAELPDSWARDDRIAVAADSATESLIDAPFGELAALVEALGIVDEFVDTESGKGTPRDMMISVVAWWLRKQAGWYANPGGDDR